MGKYLQAVCTKVDRYIDTKLHNFATSSLIRRSGGGGGGCVCFLALTKTSKLRKVILRIT